MWVALLLLTWGIEGVAGVWFCYHYWIFTEIHYGAGALLTGPGNAVVFVLNALITTLSQEYAPHRHPVVLTQEELAHFLIAVYVAAHVFFLVRGLIAPLWERRKLGVRLNPSGREIQRFEQVFAALERAKAATPDAPPLRRPPFWTVLGDDRGRKMRWIGLVLLVDKWFLMSRHFPPLLDDELHHVNRFNQITRSLS